MAGELTEVRTDLFDRICVLLAAGIGLHKACEDVGGYPAPVTVFGWMRKYPELREQYMIAKREAADAFAEDVLTIADDARNDWMESNDPDNPGWRFNGEHVQRSRLRVDTRKWLAGKLMPKVYGDSQQPGGGTVVQVMVVTGVPEPHASKPSI